MPEVAKPLFTSCRARDLTNTTAPLHCMQAYNINIRVFRARPFNGTFDACNTQPETVLIGYNGTSPGPTFISPV